MTDPKENIICGCIGVSEQDIIDAVEGGAKTFDAVKEKTGAGTGCGECRVEVEKVINECK